MEILIIIPIALVIGMVVMTPLFFIFQLTGIFFKSLASQYILASIYLILGGIGSLVMPVLAPMLFMAGVMSAGSYLTWMSFALIAAPFIILAGGVAFLIVALVKHKRRRAATQS